MNAMALDIAMGGSTNTVLHLLAIAHEAEVDFTMKDIDAISQKVPTLCKVAPSSRFHVEDVHRAGGVNRILDELNRKDLLHKQSNTVSGTLLEQQINIYSLLNGSNPVAEALYLSAPGAQKSISGFNQNRQYASLDLDRKSGCIRSMDYAYSIDGGLCVLYGNIAEDGCIVKTAGVEKNIQKFEGRARIFHSQESACQAILSDAINAGDVVLILYEGPKGGPGMQEMLYPTTYLKSKKLGKVCALITDGRFSGGTSGLSIGHVSPEAAEGGTIALVKEGDTILIDIPRRTIRLDVADEILHQRRNQMQQKGREAWKPTGRDRVVPKSLQAYSLMATSASKGAVRDPSQLH